MAADVSSLIRILNNYKGDRTVGNDSGGAKSTALMTRDLLGAGDQSQELDLDLQVPSGWEKRLDLKSGKVYLQRCNSTNITSSLSSYPSVHKPQSISKSKFQDLNFPPNSSKPLLNLFDDPNLDLKLVSSSSSPQQQSSIHNLQSVCTLDKVRSALERAEKHPIVSKKRASSSSSHSSSSSTIREEENDAVLSSPVAAGCPGCLSYVLVMKNNPICPRCNSFVPFPSMKKPKIDLNISI